MSGFVRFQRFFAEINKLDGEQIHVYFTKLIIHTTTKK